jgi:histidine ammonia-lyase
MSLISPIIYQVLTAMGTEALLGTQANFASFISDVRPHPGQVCPVVHPEHRILITVDL